MHKYSVFELQTFSAQVLRILLSVRKTLYVLAFALFEHIEWSEDHGRVYAAKYGIERVASSLVR